jgi:S1-C subfamily serine protease
MSNRNTTILAVLCVASVLFSGINTALIINNQDTQRKVNEENRAALVDVQRSLDAIGLDMDAMNRSTQAGLTRLQGELGSLEELSDSKISALQGQVEGLRQSFSSNLTRISDELSSDIGSLRSILEEHGNQTAANVYQAVYKSVVMVKTTLGQGSGFVYDDKGHIVTNWHVVEGQTSAEVKFYDESWSSAVIAGIDPYADVAVITASRTPTGVTPLLLGNSSLCSVGQEVVAVGAPFGLTGSLTYGHISQLNKRIEDLDIPLVVDIMQIDLSIAPGSSGGPLLDVEGRVLGLTAYGAGYGINFAVPSSIISRVASSIVEKGYYQHPYIGISSTDLDPDAIEELRVQNVSPDQTGMMILEVLPGLPGAEAGLQAAVTTVVDGQTAYIAKDIIVGVDGRTVQTWEDWAAYVEEHASPGQQITVKLWRSGTMAEITLTPTARPQYSG